MGDARGWRKAHASLGKRQRHNGLGPDPRQLASDLSSGRGLAGGDVAEGRGLHHLRTRRRAFVGSDRRDPRALGALSFRRGRRTGDPMTEGNSSMPDIAPAGKLEAASPITLSIIIATYDARDLLADCLVSIRQNPL